MRVLIVSLISRKKVKKMNILYKYQDFVRSISVVGRAIINMNPENFYKWEKQCNILIEKNRSMFSCYEMKDCISTWFLAIPFLPYVPF